MPALRWEPLTHDTAGRPLGAVFDAAHTVEHFVSDPGLAAELLRITHEAGGLAVVTASAAAGELVTPELEEAFYDLFPGTDQDAEIPDWSPLRLPATPAVRVMASGAASLDGHPAAPGLAVSSSPAAAPRQQAAPSGGTGSSARANSGNRLQFHPDGNFWRTLPPCWTMLSCHERSGCGGMSQQMDDAAGDPVEFVGGDTLVAPTDVELLDGRLSPDELAGAEAAWLVPAPPHATCLYCNDAC